MTVNSLSHRISRREERGAVLVLATVGFVLAMISASLAVDLGVLAADKRTDQKIADLAALDASRDLDGVTAHCSPPPIASGPFCPAVISAARNFSANDADTTISAERVAPNAAGDWVADPVGLNVRVTVSSPRKPYFPFVGSDSRTVTANAVAGAGNAIGTVRVGSTLASLSDDVPATSAKSRLQVMMLNKTVSALIGGAYSTNLVGWRGLANGEVSFGALTSELAAVTGNATFSVGTIDEVLKSDFTAAQLFTAMANALNNSGDTADVSVANDVQTIGAKANSTYLSQDFELLDLFNFGGVVVGNKEDVANTTLNVLELVKGGAMLANGSNFASFELEVDDIVGGVIPGGFTGATVSMGLIEPPQWAEGSAGKNPLTGQYYTAAHTSQLRVRVELRFDIPLTSIGSTGVISLKVPYYLDVGQGHAYLETVNCGASAEPTSVEIRGATDGGTSGLGIVSDGYIKGEAANPAPQAGVLGSALLGTVKISLTNVTSTAIGGNPGELLTFTPPYEHDSPSQPVFGGPVALPALAITNTTATVGGIISTGLLNDAINGVNASGLSFGSDTVGVSTSILKPLYDALGMSIAGADVWAPPEQKCDALSELPPQPTVTPVLKG